MCEIKLRFDLEYCEKEKLLKFLDTKCSSYILFKETNSKGENPHLQGIGKIKTKAEAFRKAFRKTDIRDGTVLNGGNKSYSISDNIHDRDGYLRYISKGNLRGSFEIVSTKGNPYNSYNWKDYNSRYWDKNDEIKSENKWNPRINAYMNLLNYCSNNYDMTTELKSFKEIGAMCLEYYFISKTIPPHRNRLLSIVWMIEQENQRKHDPMLFGTKDYWEESFNSYLKL